MKQAGITDMLFSWPYDSICLKRMIKLHYNLEMSMMICIVFYKITKIALERSDWLRSMIARRYVNKVLP